MLLQELQQEIELIHSITVQKTTHWEERVEAMKRLVSLENEFNDPAIFAKTLQLLNPCFAIQLKDLRSKVMTGICDVIQSLSEQLQLHFEETAEYIFPCLIKQLSNKKEIFFRTANSTIQIILKHTRSVTMIRCILSATGEKSSATRALAFEDIENYLTSVPGAFDHVSELKLELFTVLGAGFADSSPDVRGKCASLYWVLHKQFPEECETVFNALASSKQDRILQAQKTTPNVQNNAITPTTQNNKQERVPLRQRVARANKTQQQNDSIVVPAAPKPIKPWMIIALKKLWNNDSWKTREEILIKLSKRCTKYSENMETKDWNEVSLLVSVFLFSEGHYRVVEQAMKALGVLLRACSMADIVTLFENNKALCLKESQIEQMEPFGVTMARNYGLLGGLCFVSRCGGTQSSRSECRNILSFIANSVDSHKLLLVCIALLESIQEQNEHIEEETAYVATGCTNLMGELIVDNPYFKENDEGYVELVDLLLAVLQQTKNIGTREAIERVIRRIFESNCIEFCLQVAELDEVLVNSILQPDSLFSEEECRRFQTFGAERYTPDILGNIGWKGKYYLKQVEEILAGEDLQKGNMDKVDLSVLDGALCSMIFMCRNNRSPDWFVYFPVFFGLFQSALANINALPKVNQCRAIPLCLRLLIGFHQLVSLLPKQMTLQLVEKKVLKSAQLTTAEIQRRKYIHNCSALAGELNGVFLEIAKK